MLLWQCGGGSENTEPDQTFDVSGILIPGTIETSRGGNVTLTIVTSSKGPKTGDVVVLTSASSVSYECTITDIQTKSFTFALNENVLSGRYVFAIRRGDQTRTVASTTFSITADVDITPSAGVTAYGIVECGGKGVPGVVVSDGYEVVVTDGDGIYQMKSEKKWGYVFISIPSGYEVLSEGILPEFHAALKEDASVSERHDFSLVKADNDNYRLYILGDMHLANRNNDVSQFRDFTADMNDDMTSHSNTKMYAITLGDMTWDAYWYDNSYFFSNYLTEMNSDFKDLQVFHTMGNHDNDMKAAGDFYTAVKYVEDIGPTYYSFNLGKVHYVILDDILCKNTGAGTSASRDYDCSITDEQFDWLKKDLAYVTDKSTPVIVLTHAPIYKKTDAHANNLLNNSTTKLENALKGYSTVHVITGHTHVVYNADKSSTTGLYEHNSGAICASWWWSGKLTSGVHLSTDGAPGGYAIWSVTGTNLDWKFKGTGMAENVQFRSYDLNQVSFSWSDVPNIPSQFGSGSGSSMEKFINAYPQNSNNEILINVWNWHPSWKVEVTEEGKALTVNRVTAGCYDPLHIAALSVKRFNSSKITSEPSFLTELNYHSFKAKASSATSTLEIKVTDEFGNVYTETMKRPKTFSTNAYKLN